MYWYSREKLLVGHSWKCRGYKDAGNYVIEETKCHMVFFTTKILQNKLGYTW